MSGLTREERLLNGEALTPLTRREKFLAKAGGADIETPTPVTREEMFLSAITGGGGSSGGGGNYTTGTYIPTEKIENVSDIIIEHQLGVPPTRFLWFVTDPEAGSTSGLTMSGGNYITCLYADEGGSACSQNLSTGSSSKYYVFKSVRTTIEHLIPTDTTIHMCSNFISDRDVDAGWTLTWFAFA